jgi:hypothetical protein
LTYSYSDFLMFFCGLQFCKSNKILLTKDLSLFLLKHNHITSTFYFIFTFKHTKRCSFRLKISWYLAWEIFRFAQCSEWLLDQPSYFSTVLFLQRKSRRGLKLKRCPLYSIKAKKAYSYVSTVFPVFMAWQFSTGRIHVTVLTESCPITWKVFGNLLNQTFKIILPVSAPMAWPHLIVSREKHETWMLLM